MTYLQKNVIGEKMRLLRMIKGKTQEEVAKTLNISRSCLANYEAGRRMPDDGILQDMADYYGTSLKYLCGGIRFPTICPNCMEKELISVLPESGKLDISEISLLGKIALIETYRYLLETQKENLDGNPS